MEDVSQHPPLVSNTDTKRRLSPKPGRMPSPGSSATLQKSDCAASYWGNAVCSTCTALQNRSPIRLCGLLPARWGTSLSKSV